MISRYTLPEMGAIWTEATRFRLFAEVEVAVVRARARRGLVPQADLAAIEEAPVPPPERVHQLDAELHHDLIAFLTAYGEGIGAAARHVHYGMTSSDLLDTTTALQLARACDLLARRLDRLVAALRDRALEHRDTLCLGRTHGVAAEPTTFGLKLAGHAFAFDRDRRRLRAAREAVAVGTLPGGRPRPPRRAAGRPGGRRWRPRTARRRGPPPAAHRGARGRGAVRRGPEGLLGHAAQAQPGGGRAAHRDRQAAARLRRGRARGRRPLARARHLPLLGGAGGAARRLLRARLPAGAGPLAGRRPAGLPGADAREPAGLRRPGRVLGRPARPGRRRLGQGGGLRRGAAGRDGRLGRQGRLPRPAAGRAGRGRGARRAGARRRARPRPVRGQRRAG